jgi:prepilin-type N-terminal cleavage/methylation domain-containing protein
MTRRRRKSQQGYTLIEVMMAVAIMTVGSVGILSLHQATTRGNRLARETSTAVDLNRLVLERAHRDALMWNASGAVTSTELLSNVATSGLGAWVNPSLTIGSHAFDYQGNDTTTVADMYFCSNIRVSWIIGQDAARVDSRVWWRRSGASNPPPSSWNCNTAPATITAELAADAPRIHAVHSSTVVRWTRLNN